MKKAAPASAGRDKAEGARSTSGSDSRETELKEAGSSSSSSFSDEPQGFTLASEVYSVTLLFYFPRFFFLIFFFLFKGKLEVFVAAEYSEENMFSFPPS